MTLCCCSIERVWDSISSMNLFAGNPQPFSQKIIIKFLATVFKKEEKEIEGLYEYWEE